MCTIIVSKSHKKGELIYHKPGCFYANRIKPERKMSLAWKDLWGVNARPCRYCGGVRGELRMNTSIAGLRRQQDISIDYEKRTDAAYARTDIGCWKICVWKKTDMYALWHRNVYDGDMSLEQAAAGAFHRQMDVKPTSSIDKLINYITAHDKAKKIIREDYRKLPQHTARQKMYYRQAERRAKRAARHRVDVLFNLIEKQDPSMKALSVC